ncbi:hypothetical protein NEAUS04_0443 [Nematocida ausubeli]|nr:hypothetical protein NEAUS04_0443 [Nematocida ausubeli]
MLVITLLVLSFLESFHVHGYSEKQKPYSATGLPQQGPLYNYGSYGFVSTPKVFGGIPMGNLVVIGREKDIKLDVILFQPIKDAELYNLKVAPQTKKNQKGAGSSSEEVLAVSPLGIVGKFPYDERNPGQYFEIEISKNYPEYFKLKFNGLCITPDRNQLLKLSICWQETSRVITKQLFKFYKQDIPSPDPIYIKKGISPYYFRGCAPCNRSIPDPSNGEYLLVNSKYCEENCKNKDPTNPNTKPEDQHVPKNQPKQEYQQPPSNPSYSNPSYSNQENQPSYAPAPAPAPAHRPSPAPQPAHAPTNRPTHEPAYAPEPAPAPATPSAPPLESETAPAPEPASAPTPAPAPASEPASEPEPAPAPATPSEPETAPVQSSTTTTYHHSTRPMA